MEVLVKKILVALVAAGVVSLVASSPAAAQSDAAKVKIPFQFIVGQRVLPAGSYRIAPQTADWAVVLITNMEGGAPAEFLTTEGLPHADVTDDSSLVTFKKYDGHYFLQGVTVPGRDARQVRITKVEAERTLAKLNLLSAEPANVAK
jgi:hypothetical protein